MICYFINKGEKNEYKIKIYKNNSDIRFEFFGISINFIMIVKLEFILNIILFCIILIFKTYLDINSFYSSIVIPEVYCKIYSWM